MPLFFKFVELTMVALWVLRLRHMIYVGGAKGRNTSLHHTLSVGCNYLSLPLMPPWQPNSIIKYSTNCLVLRIRVVTDTLPPNQLWNMLSYLQIRTHSLSPPEAGVICPWYLPDTVGGDIVVLTFYLPFEEICIFASYIIPRHWIVVGYRDSFALQTRAFPFHISISWQVATGSHSSHSARIIRAPHSTVHVRRNCHGCLLTANIVCPRTQIMAECTLPMHCNHCLCHC